MDLKDITTEFLAKFRGGQLEIQNTSEHYLYRGEVEDVSVDEDTLNVKFAWVAKMEDEGWMNDERLDYGLGLWFDRKNNQPLCSVQEISDNRLMIRGFPMFVSEVLVFFPPDGSKLEPSEVRGLSLLKE